jgi:tripeptidyl-peptidase-1
MLSTSCAGIALFTMFSSVPLIDAVDSGLSVVTHEMPLAGSRTDWVRLSKATENEFPNTRVEHLEATVHETVWAVVQNTAMLRDELIAVSDPASPRYGQHYTFDEVGDLVANEKATNAVVTFLTQQNCDVISVTPRGEYIRAAATVKVWNEILDADFQYYVSSSKRGEDDMKIIRTVKYSIPEELTDSVYFVGNTVSLPAGGLLRPNAPVVSESPRASKTYNVTPSVLKSYYSIGDAVGSKASTVAVFETGQNYSPSDLVLFQTANNISKQRVAVDIGGMNSSNACMFDQDLCVEANLDVQYLMAVAENSPFTYFSVPFTSNVTFTDTLVTWMEYMVSAKNPPLVQSASYGTTESSLSIPQMRAFCAEAQKLGLQGVSIFVASGDRGANACSQSASGQYCVQAATFPATCPYVITVGATQGLPGPEIAQTSDVDDGVITSGGGFSTVFPRESFQTTAINNYLNTVSTKPTAKFNSSMRAYPDLACVGKNFEIYVGGRKLMVDGTSAASPTVAGMVALLNAERMSNGLSPLGYILPALYANNLGANVTHDITSGFNNCCENNVQCCTAGYYASAGWDPISGLNVSKCWHPTKLL